MEKITFTVGDLGPFDGTLRTTMTKDLYELYFEGIQGDETIFRDDRRIQISRDGGPDIVGKAQTIQFELTTTRTHISSGKIDVIAS